MSIIECVSEVLKISVEEVEKNCKVIDENLTYYWNSERGGAQLVVDKSGNYLAASSSVNLDRLVEEFKKGDKNKKFDLGE